MAHHKQTVGNVELVSLTDGQGGGAPTEIFPTSIGQVWVDEYPELLDGDGLIHPRYGSVAVRSGRAIAISSMPTRMPPRPGASSPSCVWTGQAGLPPARAAPPSPSGMRTPQAKRRPRPGADGPRHNRARLRSRCE